MGADVAAEEPFGPYLVYERLGVGGMATVHRALERGIEGFERIVALKRLLPHLAADASFIKSFVREAKLASLLNHVNIVQIFELGRVGTQYFISMEYIDGSDIRRILRHARKVSGPPPIHVTVGLLLQLCEALDYAHHKADQDGHPLGIVHRDVSPSNVLVTSAGQVKIIDFGIARAQSQQLRTQTGRVKGKLAYMAPEALAGKDLDARSDLFAVGVIAHELLTARPLFAAKNEYQTLMKVQRGEVIPPSTFNQGCPPELDAIVLRALARDADDRFDNASALRDELHAMRKQYGLPTADRDLASWLGWAFSLEAPGGFAGHTDQPNTDLGSRGRVRQARARRTDDDDDEEIELAWGGHEEPGSSEPVVLDEVPDVSDKALHHASALGAEARVTLDDLADFADDIPTPLPSHGRPTVDLSPPRTKTPLLRPRPGTRKKSPSNAPMRRVPVATPPDDAQRAAAAPIGASATTAPPAAGTASAASASPYAAGAAFAAGASGGHAGYPAAALNVDDGATTVDGAALDIGAGVVPSRVRTVAIPPRAIPSGSAPPRNIAAAALPPRIPAAIESSRPIPVVAAQSRSGVIPPAPSRASDFADEPSRRAALADVSRNPADASRPVVAATGTSRSGNFADEPSRRAAVADLSRNPADASRPIGTAVPRASDFASEPSRRAVAAQIARNPAEASRPIATGTARGNDFADEPSRRAAVADLSRNPADASRPIGTAVPRASDFASEPSRRAAVADVSRNPAEASRPVRVATGTSRGNDFGDEPSRRAALADLSRNPADASRPIGTGASRASDFAEEPSRRAALADVSRNPAESSRPIGTGVLPRTSDFTSEPSRRTALADVSRNPAESSRPIAGGTSRASDFAEEPSRRAALADVSRNAFADEPSRRVAAADVSRNPGSGPLRPTPLVARRTGAVAAQHPHTVPAASSAPRERRGTSPGTGTPQPLEAVKPSPGRDTLLDLVATERRPTFHIEDLGLPNDTLPAMPAMQTSEAVVRFREPTQPPPIEHRREPTPPQPQPQPPRTQPPRTQLPRTQPVESLRAETVRGEPSRVALIPAVAPPRAETASPEAPPAVTTSTRRQRLITPATALFAEPDPDANSAITTSHGFQRSSHATIPDLESREPGRSALGRVVLAVVCLALVSAATTAIALYLTRDDARSVEPRLRPQPAPARTGTVHIEVTPADAVITVGGNLNHTGAPWDAVLDAGSYQIEIHRDGYMGWLTSLELPAGQNQTLHVTLEPLGSAVAAEATLIFGSTPPGLDIVIDGALVGKTPDKRTISAGRHNIALRAAGADVWRREIDAHASAVYEFRPTIGAVAPASPSADPAAAPPSPSAAPAPAESPAPAASPGAPAPPPAAGAAGPAGAAAAGSPSGSPSHAPTAPPTPAPSQTPPPAGASPP